ncbi:MAG: 16S rRNA (guanine(966)-N(2))-methyltransferase RsmD [Cocleimonas sp.]|nr:16S rRNA (guanine(966)-N(2))-methyltransferase RsmD [Cocleimonas sp.]
MPRKKRPPKSVQKSGNNTLRIIGGKWRSRKLSFMSAPNLRPTPDRVRETLFNWLQNSIADTRCLDLFAGSGALGLEALSRGASEVIFIEKHRAAAQQLEKNLALLNATNSVIHHDAKHYLLEETKPFDIIFLDPPFRQGLLPIVIDLIKEKKLLKNNTLIYLEHEIEANYDWQNWHLEVIKETKAGQVKSYLLKYTMHID